jgi:hypothetical protein
VRVCGGNTGGQKVGVLRVTPVSCDRLSGAANAPGVRFGAPPRVRQETGEGDRAPAQLRTSSRAANVTVKL